MCWLASPACNNRSVSLLPPIPAPVTELSQSALGWDLLAEFLASHAQSGVGRAWLSAAVPSCNPEWIERQHTLVDEARVLHAAGVRPAMGSLFDPTEALAKARLEGAVLEPEEIRQVVDLAEQTAAWAAFLRDPGDDLAERLPALREAADGMVGYDLHPLVEAVRAKLLPDGSLADDASPELKRLRREMERQQRAIADSLRGALRRFAEGGTTQEDLITIRGERFVIPVKAEWKRRVPGVVHGASSSGQTVYVEPLETIELNNELVRLLEEEQAEIHRIYVAMTRQIGQYAAPIHAGARVLAELDTVMARARFALEYNAIRPVLEHAQAAQPGLSLKAARHPLLERRLRASGGAVVPVSVALDDAHRQLIISGPNTGGKTVTLKTLALAAMMAQAGIPVCAEEARLPLLTGFLADIGDAQSIEQNLSTFSAHIVRLNKIAAEAGPASLVLLDELGSATDPEEGAALAVAIAEHFLRARAWSIISTHHTSLKIYAETTPGVLNAAVGFDEQTLAPTYVLRQGVPGASAGINIAQRLGLEPVIVEAARKRLSTQTLDIARFLDKLHEQLRHLEAERLRTQQLEGELQRERARLEVEGLKEWRAKVRELEQQLQSLIKDFEYQARETVKAIDDRAAQQKLGKEAERRIARLRREFAESFNSAVVAEHTGASRGDTHAQPHLPQRVTAGDVVKLRSLGKTATIQRQVDERTYEVAIGPMKMRVSRDEIAEVLSGSAAAGEDRQAVRARLRSKGVSVQMSDPDPVMSWEVNVIGRTADEAQDEVEKFLDRAVMAGLPRIRVIHGTGMGVLRRTLRQWLQQHPHVSQVTEPPYNEGGSGATIVELRQ
jgi:DNA mismatch repair protein MutS2